MFLIIYASDSTWEYTLPHPILTLHLITNQPCLTLIMSCPISTKNYPCANILVLSRDLD